MRILTDCPGCGHIVSVDPVESTLVLFRSTPGRHDLQSRFTYRCPTCDQRHEASVMRREELRLIEMGVPVQIVDDPRDRHPSVAGRRLHSGAEAAVDAAPFTEDDVHALRKLLSREDWFDRLLDA